MKDKLTEREKKWEKAVGEGERQKKEKKQKGGRWAGSCRRREKARGEINKNRETRRLRGGKMEGEAAGLHKVFRLHGALG